MRGSTPHFRPIGPSEWHGVYRRIPGNDTAFHVSQDRVWIRWVRGGLESWCPMVDCEAARNVASAVQAGKRFFGYPGGGSFLINEHGQVLVPSPAGDGRQAWVGDWSGPLEFHDPLTGRTFDLTDDAGLAVGDPWLKPYVGIPHNLSRLDEIYFWWDELGFKVLPPAQDSELIERLRQVRPAGAVRFITTPGGLVLTKVPIRAREGTTVYEPRYVGRLNFACWFPREE